VIGIADSTPRRPFRFAVPEIHSGAFALGDLVSPFGTGTATPDAAEAVG
jgi:hypothetical protein